MDLATAFRGATACSRHENLGPQPRLDVVQADGYRLPLRRHRFDFVYYLGVLQHTPDVHGENTAENRIVFLRRRRRCRNRIHWSSVAMTFRKAPKVIDRFGVLEFPLDRVLWLDAGQPSLTLAQRAGLPLSEPPDGGAGPHHNPGHSGNRR